MPPYERLKAWEHCHALVLEVYQATRMWPADERFGLTSQVRRAAVSAAANLVEGSTRRGVREFRRYLDISNGSLAEVGYLVRVARDLGYMSAPDWNRVELSRQEAAKTVWGLYAAVGRRTNKEPGGS